MDMFGAPLAILLSNAIKHPTRSRKHAYYLPGVPQTSLYSTPSGECVEVSIVLNGKVTGMLEPGLYRGEVIEFVCDAEGCPLEKLRACKRVNYG
jgi:hypothetical protein